MGVGCSCRGFLFSQCYHRAHGEFGVNLLIVNLNWTTLYLRNLTLNQLPIHYY